MKRLIKRQACKQGHALAVHDISCFGRCSLTVALPIISACGANCAVLPTSILSTHTGGFSPPHRHDLTDDILPTARHWKSEGISFDCIYTGYLGSVRQTEILPELFEMLKNNDTAIVVDPVLGDGGCLYKSVSPDMIEGMKNLAKYAGLLLPNITEGCALVGMEYEQPHRPQFIDELLKRLGELCDTVILKGIILDDDSIGSVLFSGGERRDYFTEAVKTRESCHGSGDIFGSVLVGKLLCGHTTYDAMRAAADFTRAVIENSVDKDYERRAGLHFESELYRLTTKT